MEELKESMSGIVERSRARRSGSRLQQATPSKTSELTVLHVSPAVLQSLPCVSPEPTLSIPPSSPPVSQMSVTREQELLSHSLPGAAIVSVSPSMSVASDPASHVSCALVGSVASTYVTSISVDSLERPPISQDPSCMSSRDTISECDTEYGSQTDTECQSDSQTIGSQGDRLAHLEVASSLSIGDLSMGSDSVFISETETVSDATSRRTSAYTVNPIYFTEDQDTINISKSSLLSPNAKHVHFKFDADTSSTVSEDDRPTESPNFAQAVLTNYLSSHRNSISQVIEALSSLAQADITAEIEMTIEQNKKQKVSDQPSVTSVINTVKVDPDSVPAIEITEPLHETLGTSIALKGVGAVQTSSTEVIQLANGEEKRNHERDDEIVLGQAISISQNEVGLNNENNELDEFEQLEKVIDLPIKLENEIPPLYIQEDEEIGVKDTLKSDEKQKTSDKNVDQGQNVLTTLIKTQRKSILKNTNKQTSGEVQPAPEVKVTRQLTPTLRRRPILKKKESMVSSSHLEKHSCAKETPPMKKPLTGTLEKKKLEKVDVTNAEFKSHTKSKIKSPEQVPKYDTIGKITIEMDSSLTLNQGKDKLKSDVQSDIPSPSQISTTRVKSVSAPTTPLSPRKQRPSPPSKLPLVMSRESSFDSLKESKIPRFGRSNESTPSSTPQQIRKFSPRSDEGFSRIPKPMSREQSFDSLTGSLGNSKRNVWSEPSSPMSTPQLIRKTFKQFHENTKIPMPVYQYSSTEDLEDSSPQESPRPSREKRQRCLIRPPRAASADRATDVSFRSFKDDGSKSSKMSWRTQSPLPMSPRSQAPGKVTSPTLGRVESPTLCRGQSPISRVESPSMGRINSPNSGRSYTSSQSSSRLTSPGSSPKKIMSPSSTPRLLQSPASTPKRVQSPVPQSSSPGYSGNENRTGARPKVQHSSEPTNRVSKKRSLFLPERISASDSEQHVCTAGKERKKSTKVYKSGEMRRADSLEEFLLLENECTD